MLKVFVYSKKSSKKVAVITKVVKVDVDDENNLILIYTCDSDVMTFDIRMFKTTIYQN